MLMLAILAPLALSCDVSNDGLPGTPQVSFDAAAGGTTNLGDARSTDAIKDAGAAAEAGPSPRDARTDAGARPTDATARDMAFPASDAPPRDATPPPLDALPPLPDTPPSAEAVLLLIGNAMPSPGDMATRARLVALGFQVQIRQVSNAAQATEARAIAAGVALVVMSSSLPEASTLPADLRTLAVPILCSNSVFWADLGIGQPAGSGVSQGESDLEIVATGHPLTAGRNEEVRVVSQPRPFGYGQPVPAAVRIATIVEDQEVLIFGLEKGAAGRFEPAPARRVGWFALEATYLSFNDDGWALFDAAVRWLTGRL